MAWFESHQTRARHPKTHRLMRMLCISRPCALGHLDLLYYWLFDYAATGDLSRFGNAEIADAAEWPGDPDEFVEALVLCGWLDRTDRGLEVHDWLQYCGEVVKKRLYREGLRRDAALRTRAAIAGTAAAATHIKADNGGTTAGHVPTTADNGGTTADVGAATQPYRTLTLTPPTPPSAEATAQPSRAPAATKDPPPANGPPSRQLWDAFVVLLGTTPATRAERGKWNGAIKQLLEVGATPADVAMRAAAYRQRWPQMDLNPRALAAHWSEFGGDARDESQRPPGDSGSADWPTLDQQASLY